MIYSNLVSLHNDKFFAETSSLSKLEDNRGIILLKKSNNRRDFQKYLNGAFDDTFGKHIFTNLMQSDSVNLSTSVREQGRATLSIQVALPSNNKTCVIQVPHGEY